MPGYTVMMLHLGRSPGGPSYGVSSGSSTQQQPHLYCASRSLYLRRLLNKTRPLLCNKRHFVGCSTHKLYICPGVPAPPLHLRRNLAVSRAFVTQELIDKEEPEGEDESDALVIPRDLPWSINPSLAVHNWGTVHHGPLEARYFNSSKTFPYLVGYMSVKVYKGKDYYQSIEEGSEGPVFVVKEAELGEFKADSPQKVWSSVCKSGAIHVRGMRHFGFESSKVIGVLQAIDLQSKKKFSHKGSDQILPYSMDIASPVDVSLPDSLVKDDVDMEFLSVDTQSSGTEEADDDTDGIGAYASDLDVSSRTHEVDEDDDNDFLSFWLKDDALYSEEDVRVDAYTDVKDDEIIDGVPHVNETNENETVHASANVFSDKGVEGSSMQASTRIKQTFKAGSHKFTFVRGSWGTHEVIKQGLSKHDPVQDEGKNSRPTTANATSSKPYTPRQRTSLSAERQIWRKGEGISGYIPGQNRQQGSEKVRAFEQGESIAGVAPGYLRQQAAEKIRAGEQVSGLEEADGGSLGEEWNDGEASSVNVMDSRDSSISEAKEESFESSKSLLELLDKWKRNKEWKNESADKSQNRFLQTRRSHREDVDLLCEINLQNQRTFSTPDNEYASQGDLSLDKDENPMFNELWSTKTLDESTNFAISKLFMTEAKPHMLWDDGRPLSRHTKIPLNGIGIVKQDNNNLKSARTSKRTEILGDGLNFVSAKNPSGLKNLARSGTVLPNFPTKLGEDETIVEPLEEKIGLTEQAANEVRLIEDVRKLIANKSFGNLLEKVKAMKLSGMMIKEDVFAAIFGLELDPWQRQVYKQVQDGSSVLISTSAGAGKSAIADCCIFNNVVNEQRSLFVTPYEHLATMNLRKFKSLLGESNVGGTWTTMRMQESPKLVVVTLEVFCETLRELNGSGGSECRSFLDGVNMVVLDKFCTFKDAKYRRLWEEVLMLLDTNISVIALTVPATNEAQMAAWMSMNRGSCELISCKSETVSKRHLFCRKDGLYPLLNSEGTQANKDLCENKKVYGNSVAKGQLESSLWSGYNKPALRNLVNVLEVNALLPAIVMFLDVKSCDDLMRDVVANEIDGLLSNEEIEDVEAFLGKLERECSGSLTYADKADCEGLRKGFAVYHEGKLPLWQDIVLELFQRNLVKILIMTDKSLLHTDLIARTLVISDICKVTKIGVFSIELVQLVGRVGRRGFDIEGNIIFLESIHSEPEDAASLLLNNTFSYSSSFKPSYSFVANLMAKHNISEVKRIISRSFAAFQFFTECTKARKLKELDQEIFCCLERKADLDSKLFEGLMEVNKRKLSNAPIFTRVDIRMASHSLSQSGNVLPGILLAVVPGPRESFYMVFGADNNFRLVPAGALDHVYTNEVSPLDVLIKESTGQVLQPPLVPSKESWSMDDVSSFGYIASGNAHTKEYVKFMMQCPVQPIFAKEGLQLRKDILVIEAQLLNLIEKRKLLQAETFSLDRKHPRCYEAEAATWKVDESEVWKETMRNLHVLEKVDALSIIDNEGAYVELKPLGMLISRLHKLENELWLAAAITSKHAKDLSPAEFAGLLSTLMPMDPERESLFTLGRELSYRVRKSLEEAFSSMEVLRRQVATLQGSLTPPLHFDTAFAGLVCAWAKGKPDTNGHYVVTANDGDLVWRLRSIARLASSVFRACSHVSVDAPNEIHYRNLCYLAKAAEEMLMKHLIALDRT